MGRIAAEPDGAASFIYVPGEERVFRVVVDRDGARLDRHWQPRYRNTGDGTGLAWDGCLGSGSIWLHDNGDISAVHGILAAYPAGSAALSTGMLPFDDPLRLMRFSTRHATVCEEVHPTKVTQGWCVAPPVYVPEHRIDVGFDTGNGGVSAWRYFCGRPPGAAMAGALP